MGHHRKCLAFPPTKWLLIKTCFLGLITFARFTCQDHADGPDTSPPCISDCATCPTICSPPPPPSESRSPPKKSPPPPPQTFYAFSPPPSPPLSPPMKSPSSSSSSPPPPLWYYVWGPSAPPYKNNAPPSGPGVTVLTPATGAHGYSNPYYLLYASDASSSSSSCLVVFFISAIFLFQFALAYHW